MTITRTWVSTAIALSAFAAAGCDATAFNTFNEQYSTIKTSSSALKSTTLPAAAMATSLAAVEVMNALSSDSQKMATGGNIISPGGGNIIAPGGLNFRVAQAPDTTSTLDGKNGTLKSMRGGKAILDLTFGYAMSNEGGKYTYELTNLKGVTNGFKVDVSGEYSYSLTDGKVDGKPKADIACSVVGKMESGQSKFEIEKLAFAMSYPLQGSEKKELGSVLLNGPTGQIDIQIFMAGTTVTGSGKLLDKNGKVLQSLTLDEDGTPKFTDETAAQAK